MGAQELKPIQLPKPQVTGGVPLMQALAERKTTRAFLDKPLSAANPLKSFVGSFWRQPAPRSKAWTGPHSALGHEQAGS
jgi:hypothetical protein